MQQIQHITLRINTIRIKINRQGFQNKIKKHLTIKQLIV